MKVKVKVNNKKFIPLVLEKGLTYTKVADLTGLSPTTVIRVKNGHPCSPTTLGKIAKALNVPVTDLTKD